MTEQQPEQTLENTGKGILGDLLDLAESVLCSVFLVFLVFTFLFRKTLLNEFFQTFFSNDWRFKR